MAKRQLPSQEVLRQLLDYNPETGRLFWKERPLEQKRWNTKNACKEAFTANSRGYKTGRIFDQQFFAHRVLWKLQFGTEPDEVDHINGDRSDNRLRNLRDVSCADNGRNKAVPKNNTTGHMGVYRARRGKWRACIQSGGKQVSLGEYPTIEEAVTARESAQLEFGYHENHGRV